MGGQLSSSGHAKNALLQLQIHILPRYLSQNNSAGDRAVGPGGETSKREPWAQALSGKKAIRVLGGYGAIALRALEL